jgi:glycosyltransferase involved in cell wall biosynthesis
LSQTYKNIEIILVDDGSPDNCPQICEEYAQKFHQIEVLHKSNGGLSDARNAGIEMARGEYLIFVDSDDLVLTNMVSMLYHLCIDYDAEFVSCNHMRCNENDDLSEIIVPFAQKEISVLEDDNMKTFLDSSKISTVAWGKIYHKRLFENVRYPLGKYHEDVFTTYKLIHLANRVVVTNEIGYVYRNNAASIMNERFSLKRLHSIEGKLEQAGFIAENYPDLITVANAGIIYACNICLQQMGRCSFRDKKVDSEIKKLYRHYWRDYLKANVSMRGKLFTLAARLNYSLAKMLSKHM